MVDIWLVSAVNSVVLVLNSVVSAYSGDVQRVSLGTARSAGRGLPMKKLYTGLPCAPGYKLCNAHIGGSNVCRIFAFPHNHGGVGDPDRAQWLHVRRAFGKDQADLALIEVGPHQVERYAAGDFIAHGVELGGCGGGI
jgi:hypothetical protein